MQKEGIKETEDFIKGKMWNICSNLRPQIRPEQDPVYKKSIHILDRIIKRPQFFSGRNREVIASSIVYISCIIYNKKVSQSKLSKIGGVSEMSVRNGYRRILGDFKLDERRQDIKRT